MGDGHYRTLTVRDSTIVSLSERANRTRVGLYASTRAHTSGGTSGSRRRQRNGERERLQGRCPRHAMERNGEKRKRERETGGKERVSNRNCYTAQLLRNSPTSVPAAVDIVESSPVGHRCGCFHRSRFACSCCSLVSLQTIQISSFNSYSTQSKRLLDQIIV